MLDVYTGLVCLCLKGEHFYRHLHYKYVSSITNMLWYVNNNTRATFISWFVGSVYIILVFHKVQKLHLIDWSPQCAASADV